jgi:DNA repair photolyase
MMETSPDDFQKENLVIESDRVLVYSKMICPLGCRYCFVEDLERRCGDIRNVYMSPAQLELLGKLPENVRMIMLGCDTEFFQDEDEAERVLREVSVLGKDVSVITKLNLSERMIKVLRETADTMRKRDNILSFSVSIPCLESSKLWEPNAPEVKERIETLKKVFEVDIPSMVAIRPLIPNITEAEIDKIVELTSPYVFGYYSGPLYVRELNNRVLTVEDISNSDLSISETEPDWMPKGNKFIKIENPKLMVYLRSVIEKHSKILFDGAAQGINFIKDKKL